jgi:hypothetical protein
MKREGRREESYMKREGRREESYMKRNNKMGTAGGQIRTRGEGRAAREAKTCPLTLPSTASMRLISVLQRAFSPESPLMRRSANPALRIVFSA